MWLLESLIDTLATLQHSQICRPQRHTNRQIVIQPLFSCGESTRSDVSCYDSFKPRYLSFTDSRDMCQVSLSALHFFIIKLAIVHPWGIFWYYQNMIKGNRCNDIHNWVREIAQEFFFQEIHSSLKMQQYGPPPISPEQGISPVVWYPCPCLQKYPPLLWSVVIHPCVFWRGGAEERRGGEEERKTLFTSSTAASTSSPAQPKLTGQN